jgi:hypothetical protein
MALTYVGNWRTPASRGLFITGDESDEHNIARLAEKAVMDMDHERYFVGSVLAALRDGGSLRHPVFAMPSGVIFTFQRIPENDHFIYAMGVRYSPGIEQARVNARTLYSTLESFFKNPTPAQPKPGSVERHGHA